MLVDLTITDFGALAMTILFEFVRAEAPLLGVSLSP